MNIKILKLLDKRLKKFMSFQVSKIHESFNIVVISFYILMIFPFCARINCLLHFGRQILSLDDDRELMFSLNINCLILTTEENCRLSTYSGYTAFCTIFLVIYDGAFSILAGVMNTSGVKGVCYVGNKWCASIKQSQW
jgi:hypothetical protein